jgi:hypothetical protein
MGYSLNQFGSIIEASTPEDLFARLEAKGALLRLDPKVQPTTYRCGTVSRDELGLLRSIADVVRLGRLQAVEPTRIVLDKGAVPADPDTLYVDCSSSAIQPLPGLPVFDGARINLFMVRFCQPLFSAALIAFVESHVTDEAECNTLCTVVPSPEVPRDWMRMWAVSLANGARWRAHPALNAWMMKCRLNGQAVMARGVLPEDTARMALLKQVGAKSAEAAARLPALLEMA